jgi:hypothetical protein
MRFENIELTNIKLYKDGTVILYNDKFCGEPDRNREKLKKKRIYYISRSKVRSACIELWQKKKTKNALFITFTFWDKISEKYASKIWDNVLNGLRNNYDVKNYVWVKERQKRGAIHYHIIVDRNRIDIKRLQGTFNNSVKNIFPFRRVSNNSVRLGKLPVIYNIQTIKNYLCKYMAKVDDTEKLCEFRGRAYGHNAKYKLSREITADELINLAEKYKCNFIFETRFIRVFRFFNFIDSC